MKRKRNEQRTDKKHKKIGWFLTLSAFCATVILLCQFFVKEISFGEEKLYNNTTINGINVGEMSKAEAENAVLTEMLQNKNDIEIELACNGQKWTLLGEDFEACNNLEPVMSDIMSYGRNGNFFQNIRKKKEIEENGKSFNISYVNIFADLDEKLDEVCQEIEHEEVPASIVFKPEQQDVFEVDIGQSKVIVQRDELYKSIAEALSMSNKVKVEVPIIEVERNIDIDKIKNSVGERSHYTTNYSKSSKERKNNIKKALSSFNGMVVQPGEIVSFNETTGPRTEEYGYQNAHILVGGKYVDGVGGGVCQASTTLYNALLLADVEILSVNHHTIPASYVPLSFDAMVSGDYADLVFQNTLETPIYIKTFADDSNVTVEIYGQKLANGEEIRHKSQLMKVLPHGGDKIIADSKGQYANKIIYKGEYYRERYPREGYESKAFLQYYKDGKLVTEKEIRHDFYPAQNGVVYEGVEDAADGMTIPASDIKIVKPQKVTPQTEENVKAKLEKINPGQYNP